MEHRKTIFKYFEVADRSETQPALFLGHINPFHAAVSIIPKTSENLKYSDVFKEYRKRLVT